MSRDIEGEGATLFPSVHMASVSTMSNGVGGPRQANDAHSHDVDQLVALFMLSGDAFLSKTS